MSGFTDFLKALAPTAASLLGGPLAGLAVTAIGEALGVDEPTKDKIEAALTSGQMTGEQIAAIKLAEKNLIVKLKELDIDLERIHASDRDSARRMQIGTQSALPGILAVLVTVGFFGVLVGMMTGTLKASGNTEALLIMLGALGAAWGAVVNFYFGSSASSQSKDRMIAKKA